MDKYYTPTIDEFHFGFKFEMYNESNPEKIWYSASLGYGVLGDLMMLQSLILKKQVRVKYLDQQDIESEGWKKTQLTTGGEPEFTLNGFYIYKDDDKYYIYNGHGENGEEVGLAFTIRNRSELSRVMKMLGIK